MKKSVKTMDYAKGKWEIILTVLGIIVTIGIAIATYNSRYDTVARASNSFKVCFESNANVGNSTITASAGSVWFGVYQKSGKKNTDYDFYYKKTSEANYGSCIKSITMKENGTDGKKGDWKMAKSYFSQKYDIKIKRTSNKSSSSRLVVDWSVKEYGATE